MSQTISAIQDMKIFKRDCTLRIENGVSVDMITTTKK